MAGLDKGNEPKKEINIEEEKDVSQQERVEVAEPIPETTSRRIIIN